MISSAVSLNYDSTPRYDLIHHSIETTFELESLSAYEDYMKDKDAPCMEEMTNDETMIVVEIFTSSFLLGLHSIYRRENEISDWETVTDEDIEDVENEYVIGHPWEFERELYDDIMTFINVYQLFFIENNYVFHPISQRTEECEPIRHNSPLQEVW